MTILCQLLKANDQGGDYDKKKTAKPSSPSFSE